MVVDNAIPAMHVQTVIQAQLQLIPPSRKTVQNWRNLEPINALAADWWFTHGFATREIKLSRVPRFLIL